jgi:hypothetical protein
MLVAARDAEDENRIVGEADVVDRVQRSAIRARNSHVVRGSPGATQLTVLHRKGIVTPAQRPTHVEERTRVESKVDDRYYYFEVG